LSISSKETSSPVQREKSGAALILTICRPQAGNSIDTATAKALGDELRAARRDKDLRAVIIAGEGHKFFCSGGDLKAYRALTTKKQLASAFGRVRKLLDDFEAFPLPIIAAIDGYALGGGMEMALACDLRFGSANAKLGMPQGRLGLIPGWNGIQRLVELVGRGTAFRLLYTGETVTAQDAHAMHLLDEVAADGSNAVQHALAFVQSLDKTAPLSLAATKTVTLAALRTSSTNATRVAARAFEKLWFTRDHREAESAFAEKRTPSFHGR
jgi:enoyl-CoA hydratase/carnithine racemase